jgi:purine-cytosine permease-like protein
VGNIAPAILAVISRIFWGSVLLWLLATSVAAATVSSSAASDLLPATLATLVTAVFLALLVAFFGYALLARIQLVLTITSAVLIAGVVGMTAQHIDMAQALTIGDGPWVLALGGSVLVFSVVGLVWAHSGADLARYQRPSSGGAPTMLSATFGAAIPAFVLVAYGAILAASNPTIAAGLATSPVQTLAGLLPEWYLIPMIAAITLSLLAGVVITMYSGGLALQGAGLKLSRQWSVVAVGAVLAALSTILVVTATSGIGSVVRDFATTVAVPTAAWVGIFGSEMMIRNRRFDSESLLKRGGVYPDVRWVNLGGFAAISAVGYGLTTASVSWLSWQGFVFTAFGVPLTTVVASTDLGVVVALVLGIILPLAAGVPAIRHQESLRA